MVSKYASDSSEHKRQLMQKFVKATVLGIGPSIDRLSTRVIAANY